MRRLLAFTAILLLVAATAEARVVQAPETERGGQAVPGKATGPGCADPAALHCAISYPGGFGWFGVPDLDAISRLTAIARTELATGRPTWRRTRSLGRPTWRLPPVQRHLQPRLR